MIDKYNLCVQLLDRGCILVQEYTHTAIRNGVVIDYYQKYIVSNDYKRVRLAKDQADGLIEIAKKKKQFKLVTDKKLKARFYNKIEKPTHHKDV